MDLDFLVHYHVPRFQDPVKGKVFEGLDKGGSGILEHDWIPFRAFPAWDPNPSQPLNPARSP